MSKTKTILLWIAVPLAAVVAMTIAHILVIFLTARGLNMIFIGMDELKFAISKISGELAAGAAFVTAGTEVAPTKKKTVSIVLATIITSFCVISAIYYFIFGYELTLLKVICILAMSAGAIAYSYGYKED